MSHRRSLGRYLRVNRSFVFALETYGEIPQGHDVVGSLCQSVDMTSDTADSIRLDMMTQSVQYVLPTLTV